MRGDRFDILAYLPQTPANGIMVKGIEGDVLGKMEAGAGAPRVRKEAPASIETPFITVLR